MIDIHSHLIYGVDDGSFCLDESVKMISAAAKQGIDTIIATPHYQKRLYENTLVDEKFKILSEIASELKVELHLGSELYANDDLVGYIKKTQSKTEFAEQYLLIEIPFNAGYEESKTILRKLLKYKMKIIIAHPERNYRIMNQIKCFIDFIDLSDISLQVDAGSLAGTYGLKVKDGTKRLISLGLVDFVASNAHNSKDYTDVFSRAVDIVYKWCSSKEADRLLNQNASLILSRRPITHYKVI